MSENTTTTTTSETTTARLPEWVSQVASAYGEGIAHAFILHGNVNDYVVPGMRLAGFLTRWLVKYPIILFYDRSQGISFPSKTMETAFRRLVGMAQDEKKDEAPVNPALAALAAARGIPQAQDEEELPREPGAALPLIEKAMRAAEPKSMAVIINFSETILPDAPASMLAPDDRTNIVTVSRWGSDPQIERQGHYIFLTTANVDELNSRLKVATNKFEQVEISFPDAAGRQYFIEWLQSGEEVVPMEMSAQALANMTAGLNLMGIEDIFLRAQANGRLTVKMVKDRKQAIIKSQYGNVLEVMEPKGGFELIGGLWYVKDYYRKNIIEPIRAGKFYRVPKGVLMLGPAGTGKTITAEAVAFECGMNAVKLNIGGQIASKWQGEGERLLRQALRGIITFAPTIVFVDEVDQSMSRGGGNNQQESRMFQMMLEFMADDSHRGQVVFMGASNRPDLMDAALRRPGRFDDAIAFLTPNEEERENIFQVMAKYEYGLGEVEVPQEAITLSDGYTGAEISMITRKATILMEDEALPFAQAIIEACKRIKASTRDIERMTALALNELRDVDLVPPQYREKIGPASEDLAREAREALEVEAPARRRRRE